jgi:predicted DNA binding CopG/RHH family protein
MSKLGVLGKAILEHYPYGFFSLDQIIQITKLPRKFVSDTFMTLSKDGVVKKVKKLRKEHIPGQSPRFTLIYSTDRKALAARIAPKLKKETVQDRMWAVIRKRKSVDLRDLIVLAEARKGMARWYLKALRGLGIIHPSRSGGGPGVVWNLIKDIGVKRPYIKSNRKVDRPNMKESTKSSASMIKKDCRIHIWLSRAEIEFSKRQASSRKLSVSAYFRMLLHNDLGISGRYLHVRRCW